MARNPKLDVFRLTLKPFKGREATFKDFIQQKCIDVEGIMSMNNGDLLLRLFENFRNAIDGDEFIKNASKQKVFTAYNSRDSINSTIAMHSDNLVIEGTFKGGKFGNARTRASVNNKNESDEISSNSAILDDYYFFLHTPLDSDTGVLMLQSYTEETIRDVFVPFIQPYFSCSNSYYNVIVEPFVPKSYKEKFAREARLRAFSFTGSQMIGKKNSDTIVTEQEEFIISIKVVPKDGSKTTIDDLGDVLEKVTQSTFNDEELGKFQHKILLSNSVTKKHAHYDMSHDISQIRPTIMLDEIPKDVNGKLNIAELKQFCFDLLVTVNSEVQKINMVNEC
jgi:hypothetical protein